MEKHYYVAKCVGSMYMYIAQIHKDGTPAFTDSIEEAIKFEYRKHAEAVADKLNKGFDGGWFVMESASNNQEDDECVFCPGNDIQIVIKEPTTGKTYDAKVNCHSLLEINLTREGEQTTSMLNPFFVDIDTKKGECTLLNAAYYPNGRGLFSAIRPVDDDEYHGIKNLKIPENNMFPSMKDIIESIIIPQTIMIEEEEEIHDELMHLDEIMGTMSDEEIANLKVKEYKKELADIYDVGETAVEWVGGNSYDVNTGTEIVQVKLDPEWNEYWDDAMIGDEADKWILRKGKVEYCVLEINKKIQSSRVGDLKRQIKDYERLIRNDDSYNADEIFTSHNKKDADKYFSEREPSQYEVLLDNEGIYHIKGAMLVKMVTALDLDGCERSRHCKQILKRSKGITLKESQDE